MMMNVLEIWYASDGRESLKLLFLAVWVREPAVRHISFCRVIVAHFWLL